MITQITPKIYIGNSFDACTVTPEMVEASLNVAIDLDVVNPNKIKLYKVGLVDGPGNNPETFVAAILCLCGMARKYNKILVHCHEGKSRSVIVVSTYLSIMNNGNFDEILKDVMKKREVDDYRPALYELATISIIHY
jgi:myo-inositol-1(or 4)-monophosphatase